MIQVAYYFGRYAASRKPGSSPVPPEIAKLGIKTRKEALQLFRIRVAEGRDEVLFSNSIQGDIDYVARTLRNGQKLRKRRIVEIGHLYEASEIKLWNTIRTYLDPAILRAKEKKTHRIRLRDGASLDWPQLEGHDALPDADYLPNDVDEREIIERQIRARRGQQQFREALRKRHGERCAVTGCEVFDVIEAAHIKPYRGPNDNSPDNGLLLRADIHVLFDLNLIGIHPSKLIIELAPSLESDPTYAKLNGKKLQCSEAKPPSAVALRRRYQDFCNLST
jgi:hypothetical protein